MTFLLTLRNAAKDCSNVEYRALLRQQADEIELRLEWLHREPTKERMRELNGAWALGNRLLDNLPQEGTPAPIAGSPEPARLAA